MSIFKIRVLLDDSIIESYRDIEIETTDNFEILHNQIVQAFGLRGDQMASFYKSDKDWEKGEEIPLMEMGEEVTMRDTLIKNKARQKGDRFFYIYNFLTLWIFYVEVMDVISKDKKTSYPLVTTEYGPNIEEDSRNESSEMPEMKGVGGLTSGGAGEFDMSEFEDVGLPGLDPMDGEFEDIDDYDF